MSAWWLIDVAVIFVLLASTIMLLIAIVCIGSDQERINARKFKIGE
jgi:hypothetical protein